jgi:ligand-binding sensor domain-containing protein
VWVDNQRKVSEGISQRINEITHILCGWTIKERVSEGISQRINEITHILCGWTIKERSAKASHSGLMRSRTSVWVDNQRKVSEAISQRINEITHKLCGWTIKETVSEGISQRINEITHSCVGGQSKKRSAKPSHSGLMRSRTSVWVDNQRKGQRSHLTAD